MSFSQQSTIMPDLFIHFMNGSPHAVYLLMAKNPCDRFRIVVEIELNCKRGGWKIPKSNHVGNWESSQAVLILTETFSDINQILIPD